MSPLPALRMYGAILAFSPAVAGAQYAYTQDSTLRGLQRVYVNFQMTEDAITADLATELSSFLNLELRKAGIRVTRDTAEIDLVRDGILNVSFIKIPRSLSTDFSLRIDVEQRATLVRTNQTLQMVTWYYEDDQRNVIPDDVARGMLTKGVNKFLEAWLDVSGR